MSLRNQIELMKLSEHKPFQPEAKKVRFSGEDQVFLISPVKDDITFDYTRSAKDKKEVEIIAKN